MISPLRVDRRLVCLTIIDLESRHDLGPSPRTGIGDSISTVAPSENHLEIIRLGC
jgi:hypothetical protein